MKKLFTKAMAVVVTVAMIAALAVGVNISRVANADTDVELSKLSFSHQGVNGWGEPKNYGFINSVSLPSGAKIENWASQEYTRDADQAENGFAIDIDRTGWDAKWGEGPNGENVINPWSVQAKITSPMEAGHIYELTFDAKESARANDDNVTFGKKYCYMGFNTTVEGNDMTPYAEAGLNDGSDKTIIVITGTTKSYKFNFTNFVSGETLNTSFMLGAFDGSVDYAGNDVSDIVSPLENQYRGTVTISNIKLVDQGVDPRFTPTESTPAKPTVAPTTQPITEQPTGEPETTKPAPSPTKKLGKVTGVKVKNPKKKTIKVSWKKVKNAKKYQIKVGSKTYTSTKTSKTIKNKKFKKKKKVKVKVRATAAGYKTGAWSKTVTKKLKK